LSQTFDLQSTEKYRKMRISKGFDKYTKKIAKNTTKNFKNEKIE